MIQGNPEPILQHSPEWYLARCGKATASRIVDIFATIKSGGWGASRANYAAQLVAERLTGVPGEHYESLEMKRGNEVEPEARAAYDYFCNEEVVEVGFIEHPTIALTGCSPDGLVGADGLVEIKCPSTSTHIETLKGGKSVPKKYRLQAQWQMACTGRQWADYVSYDNRMPEHMRFWTKRIARDDVEIAELEKGVRVFLDEVAASVAQLKGLYE